MEGPHSQRRLRRLSGCFEWWVTWHWLGQLVIASKLRYDHLILSCYYCYGSFHSWEIAFRKTRTPTPRLVACLECRRTSLPTRCPRLLQRFAREERYDLRPGASYGGFTGLQIWPFVDSPVCPYVHISCQILYDHSVSGLQHLPKERIRRRKAATSTLHFALTEYVLGLQ